jgi:hypothetical protein
MNADIQIQPALNLYRVRRVSHGYIVEEALITAASMAEAHDKLTELDLDSDFEMVSDEMSVEEEDIVEIKDQVKEIA